MDRLIYLNASLDHLFITHYIYRIITYKYSLPFTEISINILIYKACMYLFNCCRRMRN